MGAYRTDDPEEEKKQREFKSNINKLTLDNFERIFGKMAAIPVTNKQTLMGFVDQIFNKALTETIFCEMYANLCHDLHHALPQCAPPFRTAAPHLLAELARMGAYLPAPGHKTLVSQSKWTSCCARFGVRQAVTTPQNANLQVCQQAPRRQGGEERLPQVCAAEMPAGV
jgi:MIF4G domain